MARLLMVDYRYTVKSTRSQILKPQRFMATDNQTLHFSSPASVSLCADSSGIPGWLLPLSTSNFDVLWILRCVSSAQTSLVILLRPLNSKASNWLGFVVALGGVNLYIKAVTCENPGDQRFLKYSPASNV